MKILTVFVICGFAIISRGAPAVVDGSEHSCAKMLKLWEQRSAGNNLAKGKTVTFVPDANYHLTRKGGTDSTDLTDGELENDSKQAIWHRAGAVGWGTKGDKNIIIDLGEPKNIGKIVWRIVAGSQKRDFSGPRRVRIYGSLDGLNAALLGESWRWSDDLEVPNTYPLPNVGLLQDGEATYVYPIEISAGNHSARYVVIRFEQDSHWFASDELAIIEGTGEAKKIDELPKMKLQTADVWIAPPEERQPVIPGALLPIWFKQTDCRGTDAKFGVEYVFELPEGVELIAPGMRELKLNSGGNRLVGPFYFKADKLTEPVKIKMSAHGEKAAPQPPAEFELFPAKMPETEGLDKHLLLGIAWMPDIRRQLWPDFFDNYRKIGFNIISTFPSGWAGKTEKFRQELDEYRRNGMEILMVYSPLHVINWSYPDDKAEYHCQNIQPYSGDSFCMGYTGKFYQNEIAAVAKGFEAAGGASYIMLDTELLGSSYHGGMKCTRCQAEFKKSGIKDYDAWFAAQAKRIFNDLNNSVLAVAKRNNWIQPQIGLYGLNAAEQNYHGMDLNVLNMFHFQNPSLYVGDNPHTINAKVRKMREASGENDIFPWLTTATYGYVTANNCKIMVWENFLNGAFGGGYYKFEDFNPAQLLAISEAVAALSPMAEVVRNGVPAHREFQTRENNVRISAVKHGNRVALLLANTGDERQIHWRHTSGKNGSIKINANDAVLVEIKL